MSQRDGHHGARKEHSYGEYDRQDQRAPKEALDVITDNDRLKREGQTDQVVWEVKETAERAAEKVKDKVERVVEKIKDV